MALWGHSLATFTASARRARLSEEYAAPRGTRTGPVWELLRHERKARPERSFPVSRLDPVAMHSNLLKLAGSVLRLGNRKYN